MIPFVIWLAQAGTVAWGSWWVFWKLKEETYEGAVLNAINDAYGNDRWYIDRGLSEGQVYQIIARVRYYTVNRIFPFPRPKNAVEINQMQAAIGKDLGFQPGSQQYNAIFNVLAALMVRIKPDTATATTSKGTLFEYIRGGVTESDSAAKLPAAVVEAATQQIIKVENKLPWFLKSKNLAWIAGIGIGVYLFGPAIRERLK